MSQSAAEIPTFTVSADADVSEVVALRRGAREESQSAPSLNDFVVKAAALVLREFPRFNASYVEGRIERYSRVNVGVAVAVDDALLVPVVADADRRGLGEIATETRRLVDGARTRSLRLEELRGGTFTVSNLGMLGVRSFTAIVDPQQTAILAVGSVRRAPLEDDARRIVFRHVMTLTLSCDHRVVYGADGARFLSRLCELLERPLVLAL
jgi:pyruvate dehydrogenase E2 component (dihydrolipoamide acetyltransferase)